MQPEGQELELLLPYALRCAARRVHIPWGSLGGGIVLCIDVPPGLSSMVFSCGIHHEFGTHAGSRTEQSSISRARNGAEPGIFSWVSNLSPGPNQAKVRCAPRERRYLVFPKPPNTDVSPTRTSRRPPVIP